MRALDCESVYSVGECVQHRGEVYGLATPIWEQAAALADRITGADPAAEYRGSKLATKLKVADVELATIGLAQPEHEDDEVVRFSEPRRGVYKTAIVRDGKLVGAILLRDLGKASFLTQAFDRGTVLPQERAALLFDLGGPTDELGAGELPDDAQICSCNGVSKRDIREAARPPAPSAPRGHLSARSSRARSGGGPARARGGRGRPPAPRRASARRRRSAPRRR
jgi:nitrite reductase (NADH) large subunit